MWPFVLIALLALPIGVAIWVVLYLGPGYWVSWQLVQYLRIPRLIAGLIIPVFVFLALLIGGVIGAIVRASANSKTPRAIGGGAPAGLIGWTNAGQPVYPVVGYTADGKPVTADKMVGTPPPYPGPNPSDRVR